MAEPLRVAIVGAGWAGLAAGVALATAGARVSVFEAGRTLGGRARRVERHGRTLDNGQHILAGAYTDTLRLMRAVGVDPERALLRLPLTLDYPGELRLRAPRLPAPLHLAAALLGARGLSWRERVAAARLPRALDAVLAQPADETVDALLDRLAQPARVRTLIWDALCVSALNTPSDRASARVFARVLRDTLGACRSAADLLLPRVDLGALFPEPAARLISERGGRVITGAAIAGVVPLDAGYRLEGDPLASAYDHVILAVAAHQLPPLLRGLPALAQLAEWSAGLPHLPILTCYLTYPDRVRLPAPMIGHEGGLSQWFFDRGQLGGPAGLIAAVASARGAASDTPREGLGQRIHAELCGRIGRRLPDPCAIDLIAERRATFACTPALVRPPATTALPGLLLAGDYVDSPYPGTLETAVRSGLLCARHALGRNGQPQEALVG